MAYGSVLTDTVQSSTASTPPVFKDGNGTQIGTLCRAWVNFNGTGTVAIRGSFNVSSITDDGTGQYTVNFTTAMPDTNYSLIGTGGYRDGTNNNEISWVSLRRLSTAAYSTTACAISTGFTTSNSGADLQIVNVSVFR